MSRYLKITFFVLFSFFFLTVTCQSNINSTYRQDIVPSLILVPIRSGLRGFCLFILEIFSMDYQQKNPLKYHILPSVKEMPISSIYSLHPSDKSVIFLTWLLIFFYKRQDIVFSLILVPIRSGLRGFCLSILEIFSMEYQQKNPLKYYILPLIIQLNELYSCHRCR